MNIPGITHDELIDAAEENEFGLGNIGYCTSCGAESDQCEPDARKLTCDECGKDTVYSAQELLLMGY